MGLPQCGDYRSSSRWTWFPICLLYQQGALLYLTLSKIAEIPIVYYVTGSYTFTLARNTSRFARLRSQRAMDRMPPLRPHFQEEVVCCGEHRPQTSFSAAAPVQDQKPARVPAAESCHSSSAPASASAAGFGA